MMNIYNSFINEILNNINNGNTHITHITFMHDIILLHQCYFFSELWMSKILFTLAPLIDDRLPNF